MNRSLKNNLNAASKKIVLLFSSFGKTIVSILRICVLSSAKVARQAKSFSILKHSQDCYVLGNGPSLSEDIARGRLQVADNDVLCVNMFCLSPSYRILKPRFYFLLDAVFFNPTDERSKNMVNELITAFNTTDWDMFLIVSSSTESGGLLLNSMDNDHVKVLRMNSTGVNGFRRFRQWTYRHRLGMPHCQTVVNFALCSAVNLGYKNIYLYGADHTWTRDLFVDDNNVVCYGDRHVYNKNLTVIKKSENFAFLLLQFAKMFQAHYLLEEYSKSVGAKIWNCSSDTFLDAYERMK